MAKKKATESVPIFGNKSGFLSMEEARQLRLRLLRAALEVESQMTAPEWAGLVRFSASLKLELTNLIRDMFPNRR